MCVSHFTFRFPPFPSPQRLHLNPNNPILSFRVTFVMRKTAFWPMQRLRPVDEGSERWAGDSHEDFTSSVSRTLDRSHDVKRRQGARKTCGTAFVAALHVARPRRAHSTSISPSRSPTRLSASFASHDEMQDDYTDPRGNANLLSLTDTSNSDRNYAGGKYSETTTSSTNAEEVEFYCKVVGSIKNFFIHDDGAGRMLKFVSLVPPHMYQWAFNVLMNEAKVAFDNAVSLCQFKTFFQPPDAILMPPSSLPSDSSMLCGMPCSFLPGMPGTGPMMPSVPAGLIPPKEPKVRDAPACDKFGRLSSTSSYSTDPITTQPTLPQPPATLQVEPAAEVPSAAPPQLPKREDASELAHRLKDSPPQHRRRSNRGEDSRNLNPHCLLGDLCVEISSDSDYAARSERVNKKRKRRASESGPCFFEGRRRDSARRGSSVGQASSAVQVSPSRSRIPRRRRHSLPEPQRTTKYKAEKDTKPYYMAIEDVEPEVQQPARCDQSFTIPSASASPDVTPLYAAPPPRPASPPQPSASEAIVFPPPPSPPSPSATPQPPPPPEAASNNSLNDELLASCLPLAPPRQSPSDFKNLMDIGPNSPSALLENVTFVVPWQSAKPKPPSAQRADDWSSSDGDLRENLAPPNNGVIATTSDILQQARSIADTTSCRTFSEICSDDDVEDRDRGEGKEGVKDTDIDELRYRSEFDPGVPLLYITHTRSYVTDTSQIPIETDIGDTGIDLMEENDFASDDDIWRVCNWSAMYKALYPAAPEKAENMNLFHRTFHPHIQRSVFCMFRRRFFPPHHVASVFNFWGANETAYWLCQRIFPGTIKRTLTTRSFKRRRSETITSKSRFAWPCVDCAGTVIISGTSEKKAFCYCQLCFRDLPNFVLNRDPPMHLAVRADYEPNDVDKQSLRDWVSMGEIGVSVIFTILNIIGPSFAHTVHRSRTTHRFVCSMCGIGVLNDDRRSSKYGCTWCNGTAHYNLPPFDMEKYRKAFSAFYVMQ